MKTEPSNDMVPAAAAAINNLTLACATFVGATAKFDGAIRRLPPASAGEDEAAKAARAILAAVQPDVQLIGRVLLRVVSAIDGLRKPADGVSDDRN